MEEQQAELERRRTDNLRSEITRALNRASAENGSDTPDFVLANYLMDCLRAFDQATLQRSHWLGLHQTINGDLKKVDSNSEG